MLSRVKNLATKYNQLVAQLRDHGVDFLLATGKSPATKALENRLRKTAEFNKTGINEMKISGFYSTLDRGSTTQQLMLQQSSMKHFRKAMNKRVNEDQMSMSQKRQMRSHLNLTGMHRETGSSVFNLDGEEDKLSIQQDTSQTVQIGKSLQSLPIRKARKDGAISVPDVATTAEQQTTLTHLNSSKGLSQRKKSLKNIEKM